jgi:hypothetical protein
VDGRRAAAFFLAAVLLLPGAANADWGVEAELVQPFIPSVHIISARGTRTVWGDPGGLRGDVMLGLYARPAVAHDIVERIDEYLVSAGYRQYFVRGLHVESAVLAGWAVGTKNLIDGQDYSHPAVLMEALVGYRFGFLEPGGFFSDAAEPGGIGFYASPQFGFIAGLSTDIGPRGGQPDFFIQGKLLVGVSFW